MLHHHRITGALAIAAALFAGTASALFAGTAAAQDIKIGFNGEFSNNVRAYGASAKITYRW